MDALNGSCSLVEKLIIVFRKITESHFKIADDSYLEKLLTNIRQELDKNGCKHLQSKSFTKTFENTIKIWEQTPPDATVAGFVIRFIGALSKNEADYNIIQESNIIDGLLHCLDMEVLTSSPLIISYINLLSDVINHESGCSWVKKTKAWKNVIKLCFSNSSMYVERETAKFITKLLSIVSDNNEILEDLFRDVLFPLITCAAERPANGMDADAVDSYEEKLQRKIGPSLKLLFVILDFCIMTPQCSAVPCLLLHTFDIETKLKILMETSESENLLEMVATTYALLHLVSVENNQDSKEIKQIPMEIHEIFKILVKRQKIYNVIKLAKHCQLVWNKVSSRASCNAKFDGGLEIHFIAIQIIPVMMFVRSTTPKNSFLDMYINKLFDITTEHTQRLAYAVRDAISSVSGSQPADYALKSVLSLTKNIQDLTLDRAVLIFQAMAYVLKEFVPRCCTEEEPITDEQFEKARLLCVTESTLLSAILNALCTLIETFHINWTESLESLCLLKFTSLLLDNPNLSPLLAVQTLLLIKLAIQNFMSPHLALLTNIVEGTSFDCLIPLLYKRLHDQNWEIRDSCVEVVNVIADLADLKYPAFQELLIEHKLCTLLVAIFEGDSESYVRASALRAVSAVVKIDKLWNQYLNTLDIPSKVILILQNESEGIVRREAALLMKEIYEHQHIRPESLELIYKVMGNAAIYDLHWEVKVNALFFWEKVIHRFIANQGMIDGSFPAVTFSKENKKIVTLTGAEIKTRLNKVLKELSNSGCLHVLLTTLHDDCDFQVVQKSAQIIKELLSVLKRYGIIQSFENGINCDKNSAKRKTSDEGCCEKKMHIDDRQFPYRIDNNMRADDDIGAKSDKIIEDIVNEMDINLLVSVCNPGHKDASNKNRDVLLKNVQPQVFLDELRNFDLNTFLNEKSRWLVDSGGDLSALLNDILTIHSECEMNVLDCY